MPDLGRLRLIRGQGGSSLVELLVAIPLAVAVLGLVLQAFVDGSDDQRALERRGAALKDVNIGLERVTKELRQASWVHFFSSQVVDAEAMVRPGATSEAVRRHVRYDCTSGACWRYEGPAVAYPPSQTAAWTSASLVIGAQPGDTASLLGRVLSQDVFVPKRVDPASGATTVDYLAPDLLHIRLRVAVKGLRKPLEVIDGVSLRNTTKFAR